MFFSFGSVLKSPNNMTSYFSTRSFRALLMTYEWDKFFYLNYRSSKKTTFFFSLISTKNPSKGLFSINFNLICFEGISSFTVYPLLYTSWYQEESEASLFKSGRPSNLSLPNNLGLQGLPFQSLNITYDPLKQS